MNIFDSIAMKRPKRNKFNLSHEKKLSMQMGKLVPVLCLEAVPGDKFRINTENMIRLAPMLAPVMHRMDVTVHYFKVPYRLIWDEFQDFITGGRQGTSAPVAPFTVLNENSRNSFELSGLADYLGIPVPTDPAEITNPINLSVLPFRAYQLIWNEYYRDQNLTPELEIPKTSGEMVEADFWPMSRLRDRCWEKDYFTSALPWPQRGGDVSIPITGEASVDYKPISEIYLANGTHPSEADALLTGEDPNDSNTLAIGSAFGSQGRIENIEEIELDNMTATINDLRRSVKLQEWLEKNARGGARYIEQILSHFGVKSSDARLQRPEYLGGGKSPVVFSEVLSSYQDLAAEDALPQGNMAGHGISVGKSNRVNVYCEEHCFVIGLMSILPRTAYQQGVPKMFTRTTKFDYLWPEFAQLGEQEIRLKELWYNPQSATPAEKEAVFGYTPRYAEYKYHPSTVHGVMKTNLAYWHMGRIFENKPALNTAFVTADPTTRIFAVEEAENEHFYVQLYNAVSAIRPLPYYGTPTL